MAFDRHAHNRTPRARYAKLVYHCRRSDIQLTIDFDHFLRLNTLPCHYCGLELSPAGYNLDRADSAGAYSPDNVVPCCTLCNATKSDRFTYAEFTLLAPVIRSIVTARKAS